MVGKSYLSGSKLTVGRTDGLMDAIKPSPHSPPHSPAATWPAGGKGSPATRGQ